MATIQLTKLAKCNQAPNTPAAQITYYNNIYVNLGSDINANSAREEYSGSNPQEQRHMREIFGEMESQSLSSVGSPITRNNSLVFHLSRGNRNTGDSASVFFRIYALEPAQMTRLQGGQSATALEVVFTNKNSGIFRISVKTLTGGRIDGLVLDCSDFTVNVDGIKYQLIFDVVGIGYHAQNRNNDKYKLDYRNSDVLNSDEVDLSQTVL